MGTNCGEKCSGLKRCGWGKRRSHASLDKHVVGSNDVNGARSSRLAGFQMIAVVLSDTVTTALCNVDQAAGMSSGLDRGRATLNMHAETT